MLSHDADLVRGNPGDAEGWFLNNRYSDEAFVVLPRERRFSIGALALSRSLASRACVQRPLEPRPRPLPNPLTLVVTRWDTRNRSPRHVLE